MICPYSSKDALNNKHITDLGVHVTTLNTCAITSEWSRRTPSLQQHRTQNTMNTDYYCGNTCWRPLITAITSRSCSCFKTRKLLETMAWIINFLKVTPRSSLLCELRNICGYKGMNQKKVEHCGNCCRLQDYTIVKIIEVWVCVILDSKYTQAISFEEYTLYESITPRMFEERAVIH